MLGYIKIGEAKRKDYAELEIYSLYLTKDCP